MDLEYHNNKRKLNVSYLLLKVVVIGNLLQVYTKGDGSLHLLTYSSITVCMMRIVPLSQRVAHISSLRLLQKQQFGGLNVLCWSIIRHTFFCC